MNLKRINLISILLLLLFSSVANAELNISIDSISDKKNINIEWEKKINLYNKTKNKYIRTIVCENPKEGITSYLNENNFSSTNYFNSKIKDYFINNETDLIYSKNNNELVLNHKSNLGLKINGSFKHKLTENLIVLYSDQYSTNFLYDLKKATTGNIDIPRLEFDFIPNSVNNFNSDIYFPYLRLSVSNYLFKCNSKERINFNNTEYISEKELNKLNNNDILYSIKDSSFKILENEMSNLNCSFNLITSNSNSKFILNNIIYNIEDLEPIKSHINFNISSIFNEIGIENLHYSFNDSDIIIYNNRDKSIFILNFYDSTKYRKINSNLLNRIYKVNFLEIDKFSKYIYLTYSFPYYFNEIDDYGYIDKKFKNKNLNYYHPKELIVLDMEFNKVVYLGPEISIDYSCDKLGYVMTKASDFSLNDSLITILNTKDNSNYKYDLGWEFVNGKIPESNNSVDNRAYLPVYKSYWKRYLLNMNPLFNLNFEESLSNFEKKFDSLNNNFFMDENLIKKQKIKYLDSILCKSYNWSYNLSNYEHKYYNQPKQISDSSFLLFQYNNSDSLKSITEGEFKIDSMNSFKYFYSSEIKMELLSVKKNNTDYGTDFIFLLKSSYLDSEVVKIINSYKLNENFSNSNNVTPISNFIIVKDSIGYTLYYKIKFSNPIDAKKFNDSILKNPMNINFSHFYNLDASINCLECIFINNMRNFVKINSSNYLLNFCKLKNPLQKYSSVFNIYVGETSFDGIIKPQEFNLGELKLYDFNSNFIQNY